VGCGLSKPAFTREGLVLSHRRGRELSTWMRRRSTGSPTAAAGVPTAAAEGRSGVIATSRSARSFNYVHSLVDDHSRLAYFQRLPGE
jgi:hypothetical protein